MMHVTAGIFGNAEYAKKLGKQGTTNDLSIYNHGSSEGVFTYVCVCSDKVQPLLQAINMIDVPVIVINELTPMIGEQMIAIAEFGFNKGFIILEGVSKEQIAPLVKGTCIENFTYVKDNIELVQHLKELGIERDKQDLHVPIDNYFNVKSVGTVVLGIMKSGVVKKHDKVIVEPLGKEVVVKGIQSQDRDIDIAEAGMRVGLNLKGIEAEELKRGYVVGNAMKSKTIKLDFTKCKFSKESLNANEQVFVSSGLIVATAMIKNVAPLELHTEGQFIYRKNSRFIIASTKQTMPRIIGHGTAV